MTDPTQPSGGPPLQDPSQPDPYAAMPAAAVPYVGSGPAYNNGSGPAAVGPPYNGTFSLNGGGAVYTGAGSASSSSDREHPARENREKRPEHQQMVPVPQGAPPLGGGGPGGGGPGPLQGGPLQGRHTFHGGGYGGYDHVNAAHPAGAGVLAQRQK